MGRNNKQVKSELKISCYLKIFLKYNLAGFYLLDVGFVIFTLQYLTKKYE